MLQAAPTAEKTPPDPVPDRLKASVDRSAEAAVELYLTILQDLALMGVRLARREVERAADYPTAGAAAGLMLDRVSRMVRRNAALDARLREDISVRKKAAEAERAQRAQVDAEERAKAKASADAGAAENKTLVHEVVLKTLKARAPRDRIEQLVSDLHEKLSDPDEDMDFEDAPISALVSRVCKALGVEPDWAVWEDEDWALEEAEAWTPGSPYPLWRGAARGADQDEVDGDEVDGDEVDGDEVDGDEEAEAGGP
jgi:hypothetical protein